MLLVPLSFVLSIGELERSPAKNKLTQHIDIPQLAEVRCRLL